MGNWKTVRIVGTMSAEDAQKVRKYLSCGFDSNDWGCLHNGGMAGLPNWGKEKVNCIGNLGERGYDEDSILKELEKISEFAPSLSISIHMGDDYERTNCVKSIVLQNGKGQILDPLIEDIGSIPQDQVEANLLAQLRGF
jgi:hypothetical protein